MARAGAVPAGLLAQAQANPDQTFDVIVQSADPGSDPVGTAVAAITRDERKALKEAERATDRAAKKAAALSKKAADAANKAAKAEQRAAAAADKAARNGSPKDQTAAAKAKADAEQAAADAQAAQDASAAAQGELVVAQMAVVQTQASLLAAEGDAQSAMHRTYSVIPAVDAVVTGADILGMKESDEILAVTPDSRVRVTALSNPQKWVDAMQAKWYWGSSARKRAKGQNPTIAIVDSGVDATLIQNFDNRLLGQVTFASLAPNSPGDGRGHGTMVASIAAGGYDKRAGANPDAPLVSIDVINDNGEGLTSDVIAAADWILQNKSAYNIRVANFSLEGAVDSSFMFDPLSKAVEQLWFNGVVVVAAAGNYAVDGAQSGVRFAPASDPFVITVGAVDINKDGPTGNDVAAPWSAWGYTNDGFLKPEISAPGRYVIGACPQSGTLCQTGGQEPRLASQGYLQLSGTSFAAPMVSGAAAAILALRPDWTPDQVKGQLMLTATALSKATPGSVGVGELNMKKATESALKATPPNPNLALDAFVASTPAGPVFDAASWSSAAQANASWNTASWSSASWSSASWSSASWSSASWSSASWSSASWSSASWTSSATPLGLTDYAAFDGAGEG